jgi:hypothetical protein
MTLSEFLRSQQSTLFATHDSWDSFFDWVDRIGVPARGVAATAAHIAANTVLEMLAISAETGGLPNPVVLPELETPKR